MTHDMNQVLETAIKHWRYIAPLVRCPKNKKEYEGLLNLQLLLMYKVLN